MITPSTGVEPTSRRPILVGFSLVGLAVLATVGFHRAARNNMVKETGFVAAPAEKWNLGNLGLCRAEWASCHLWDCCDTAGDGKPMWCNPRSGGTVAGVGKARCVVCEDGIETGHGEGSGERCDITQKNGYGKDGVDEVAAEAAQVAANMEAERIKGSMKAHSYEYEDVKTK